MRESERNPRPRERLGSGQLNAEDEAALLGRNEGTVRFLFAPPSVAGNGY